MRDSEQPSSDTPAETEPYQPFFMEWRRKFGPSIKQTLAPESARTRRWWWNRVFVQVPPPAEFLEEQAQLLDRLAAQEDRSGQVLAEAQAQFARPFETSDGVERRATTLQGAVAIAASFVLAGGGLLLDPSKIRSESWRLTLGALYALVIISLVFSALRALRATSRVLVWHYPDGEDLLKRGEKDQSASNYELAVAAELLKAAGRNASNARYKVAQMRAAGHWFALALAGLLATAVLLVAYLIAGPNPSSGTSSTVDASTSSSTLTTESHGSTDRIGRAPGHGRVAPPSAP
jgi:hypothetical protein